MYKSHYIYFAFVGNACRDEPKKTRYIQRHVIRIPDSKVRGAHMGPTWVLSAPDGRHVGPMNLAIRDIIWLMAAATDSVRQDPRYLSGII